MSTIPMRLHLEKKYYIDINRYYIFYGYNSEKGKYYGDYVTPSGFCSTTALFDDSYLIDRLLYPRGKSLANVE